MRFLKSIVSASYIVFAALMIVSGFGMIALAFISSLLQLQIALGIIGLGFISLGLVQLKRARNESINEKRFDQIMLKLDEIQLELKKEEPPKRTGVAIADIISSSLKYYADQVTKPKKEE
jgi:hypothetical protein